MAGSSMTGLWIYIILEHSGQVLELWPITLTTKWPQWHPVSSRRRCIRCSLGGEAGWLLFGTLTTNLNFPSRFFAIYLKWTIVGPGLCLSSFSAIGCFQTSWYSPPKSHLLWFFSLFCNFWLPLHKLFCFAWLLQYRSSSCAVSNSA